MAINFAGRTLDTALQCALVQKAMKDQSDKKSKESSPGPLDSENKWTDWKAKFENYLATKLGSDGVPLSFAIREVETPPVGQTYSNFVEETIVCVPLQGVHFKADSDMVYTSLTPFTTGYPLEDWIKETSHMKNGRISMATLRSHFAGEGNITRRIAEVDCLKEGEPMEEDTKIRFLFKKIEYQGLQALIEALNVRITTGGPGSVSYTTAVNHISTAVSKLPEYVAKHNRNVSSLGKGNNGQSSGIYDSDGEIITGTIANWPSLSR
eukprot:6501963-Ditylum_brightwellii.AAC.1